MERHPRRSRSWQVDKAYMASRTTRSAYFTRGKGPHPVATPVISAVRRQRQEHGLKFKAKLIYIASSRLASNIHQDPVSKLGMAKELKTLLQREYANVCPALTLPSPCNHHLILYLFEFLHIT